MSSPGQARARCFSTKVQPDERCHWCQKPYKYAALRNFSYLVLKPGFTVVTKRENVYSESAWYVPFVITLGGLLLLGLLGYLGFLLVTWIRTCCPPARKTDSTPLWVLPDVALGKYPATPGNDRDNSGLSAIMKSMLWIFYRGMPFAAVHAVTGYSHTWW